MDERGVRDELHGLIVPTELDQSSDDVQAMREVVLLCAQRFGEAAHIVELAQESFELRSVAKGNDCSDRAPANVDWHAVRDDDALTDEHDLIGPFNLAEQHLAEPARGNDLVDEASDCRRVEAEQPLRLVVQHRNAPGSVRCDRTLADPVQHRFALLEERSDLVRLETERLALDASC